jgi:hypothetical protein
MADDISKSSRRVIRKLVKELKYHAQNDFCEKNCDCQTCKALRFAKKEDAKLTEIITTNQRARQLSWKQK